MDDFKFIDMSDYPLVRIGENATTDEQIQGSMREFGRIFAEKREYALLLDGKLNAKQPADQRRTWTAWMKAHSAELNQFNRGIAVYNTGPMIRGLLAAFGWFVKLDYDIAYFDTEAQAIAWAKARTQDLEDQKKAS